MEQHIYIAAYFVGRTLTSVSGTLQIIEVLLVSLITSMLSFGLPMMTSCKPCPDPAKYPDVVCPRPSHSYGNYVNVSSSMGLLFSDADGESCF